MRVIVTLAIETPNAIPASAKEAFGKLMADTLSHHSGAPVKAIHVAPVELKKAYYARRRDRLAATGAV